MGILRSTRRTGPLPSCSITIEDLTFLRDIVVEINEDCKNRIIEIREAQLRPAGVEFNRETERAKLDNLLVRIQIWNTEGEQIITHDPRSLLVSDLPRNILRIEIDNISAYKFLQNDEFVENYFALTIDFSTPPVFDLLTSPSRSTPNSSKLDVHGQNSTWVEGS